MSQSSDPANLGAGATVLYDQMPDRLAFTGAHTMQTHQSRSPEGPPVAILQAIPNTGCAPVSRSSPATTHSNGTITAGQGASQITFTAGSKGSVTLSVSEISAAGCVSPAGTFTVTIGRK